MTMLQKNFSQPQALYEDQGPGLDLWHYYAILKKRLLILIVLPVLVFTAGFIFVMFRPATYLAEGKILIESAQIPIDLVRPTVSSTAAARIQVMEQRVMTRDNLLAIVDKFQVFANEKIRLSGSEMLDKMRERAKLKPYELDLPRQRTGLTIAFSVSFEHERPDIALRVANELMTLILSEDARSRTSRAMETTKFLERETKRLESELGSVEGQISEYKRRNKSTIPEKLVMDLATLRAELQQKIVIYSETHPSLKGLQQQVAAIEKTISQAADVESGLDALERQQSSIQKNLEDLTQKLTIARRGEALERDQQSERLEVIEQPVLPTTPVKGNRLKLLMVVLGATLASGIGGVFAAEMFDKTIRGSSDLERLIDPHLIASIPYITTNAEALRQKTRISWVAKAVVAILLIGLAAIHFLWMPLVQLWDKILLRIMA
jgi:uncharacterized protein involved in exopolysaccharide biosynthesis